MGGKSSSSSAQTAVNTNVDQSGSTGAQSVVTGANSTVTLTDQGAVTGAFEFGAEALGFADNAGARQQETSLEAMTQVRNMADRQTSANLQTLSQVGELAETFRSDGQNRDQQLQKIMVYGGMALVAVAVVAYVYTNRKKG